MCHQTQLQHQFFSGIKSQMHIFMPQRHHQIYVKEVQKDQKLEMAARPSPGPTWHPSCRSPCTSQASVPLSRYKSHVCSQGHFLSSSFFPWLKLNPKSQCFLRCPGSPSPLNGLVVFWQPHLATELSNLSIPSCWLDTKVVKSFIYCVHILSQSLSLIWTWHEVITKQVQCLQNDISYINGQILAISIHVLERESQT